MYISELKSANGRILFHVSVKELNYYSRLLKTLIAAILNVLFSNAKCNVGNARYNAEHCLKMLRSILNSVSVSDTREQNSKEF